MAKRRDQMFNKPSSACWEVETVLRAHPDLEYAGGGDKNSYFGLADDPDRHDWPRGVLIRVMPKKVQIVKRDYVPGGYRRQIVESVRALWDREHTKLPLTDDGRASCDWFCSRLVANRTPFSVTIDSLVDQLRMHVANTGFMRFSEQLDLAASPGELARTAAGQFKEIRRRHILEGAPDLALVEDFGVTLIALGNDSIGDAFIEWTRDSARSPFTKFLRQQVEVARRIPRS